MMPLDAMVSACVLSRAPELSIYRFEHINRPQCCASEMRGTEVHTRNKQLIGWAAQAGPLT